ncbi:MAG: hypothetical protein ABI405_12075 [Parafilimonas sp.]
MNIINSKVSDRYFKRHYNEGEISTTFLGLLLWRDASYRANDLLLE